MSVRALALWLAKRKQSWRAYANKNEQRRPKQRQRVAKPCKEGRRVRFGDKALKRGRFTHPNMLAHNAISVDHRAYTGGG